MNDWPIGVVGIEKDGSSISFSPTAAKAEGYAVYPLVEIGLADIFDMLAEEFMVKVDYVYLAKIDMKISDNRVFCPLGENTKLITMHKSHFLNEIHSGIYLESFFTTDGVLLLMLGDDESWLVVDTRKYSYGSSKLEHLIAMSKYNIQVLQKDSKFEEFFRS